jgi:hypothetical protein
MILYKTFSRLKGMTATGMLEGQEEARAQAQAFIARELQPDDVISITEAALPSTWSQGLFTVTVWYRKSQNLH